MKTLPTNSIRVIGLLFLSIILAAGCSNDDSPTNSGGGGGTSRPHFKQVSIQGNSFSPSSLTIAVGDTVLWTNQDGVQHTVTSNTGSELGSALLSNGQTYQHIFGAAGPFPYHCTVHGGMTGTVTVQ